jgi:hypothetical protein
VAIGLTKIVSVVKDLLRYDQEIQRADEAAIFKRTGLQSEVARVLRDSSQERRSVYLQVEGTIVAESNARASDSDGTSGYQFGTLVEGFLKSVSSGLASTTTGQAFQVEWRKSFSEGYDKTAGENNCYIYIPQRTSPVHLFLTTGVDAKKAMEKKESFMLEYYTPNERTAPVRIL